MVISNSLGPNSSQKRKFNILGVDIFQTILVVRGIFIFIAKAPRYLLHRLVKIEMSEDRDNIL